MPFNLAELVVGSSVALEENMLKRNVTSLLICAVMLLTSLPSKAFAQTIAQHAPLGSGQGASDAQAKPKHHSFTSPLQKTASLLGLGGATIGMPLRRRYLKLPSHSGIQHLLLTATRAWVCEPSDAALVAGISQPAMGRHRWRRCLFQRETVCACRE